MCRHKSLITQLLATRNGCDEVTHCQSDHHLSCFKSNIAKTSERRGGAHMGVPKCSDTSLKGNDLCTSRARQKSQGVERDVYILNYNATLSAAARIIIIFLKLFFF